MLEGKRIVMVGTFHEMSPMSSEPPALVDERGEVLFDSRTICEYLDAFGHGPPLFPLPGVARWRALRLQSLGDGIMDAGVAIHDPD